MRVLVPKKVLPANYAKEPQFEGYTNDGDFPEWNVGTTYSVGAKVIVDSLQSTFEAVAGSTGTAPTLTMTTPWVRIGASNAWKPFDGVSSSQLLGYTGGTQRIDRVRFRLSGMKRWNTIAVLNTDCSWVRVLYEEVDGYVYDKRIDAVDTANVVDGWTYCFADLNVRRDFVFDGVDGHLDASIAITIHNDDTGIQVKCGEVIIGETYDLGSLHSGASLALEDYSRKEKNAFGDIELVERNYSNNASFELSIPADRLSRVQGLVRELRATPCVYFSTETDANQGLVVYGFPRDFRVTYVNMDPANRYAYATLEIEGLT